MATKSKIRIVTTTLCSAVVMFIITTHMGSNEAYRFGRSWGGTLRESEEEDEELMDLKDLDAALGDLEGQFGNSPEARKLFGSENFTEGATNGYYRLPDIP